MNNSFNVPPTLMSIFILFVSARVSGCVFAGSIEDQFITGFTSEYFFQKQEVLQCLLNLPWSLVTFTTFTRHLCVTIYQT